ncbi:carboxypeptidase Y-deficient [Coemansia sp. RSA 1200]|nr:carboxypeptidase Y-deficient [Coemansia sp. RSA 1200]
MSQSVSPGKKDPSSPHHTTTSAKHVRRAARTLGAANNNSSSSGVRRGSVHSDGGGGSSGNKPVDGLRNGNEARLLGSTVVTGGSGSSGRRNTVSSGTAQHHGATSMPRTDTSHTNGTRGDAGTMTCPICGVMAPSLFALNVHLDDIHFGGSNGGGIGGESAERLARQSPVGGGAGDANGVRSRYASQDDLEEVKGAILGFFRGAGKAVKGLGGVSTPTAVEGSPQLGASGSNGFHRQQQQSQRQDMWQASEREDGADRGLVTRAHWQKPGVAGSSVSRCSVPACASELATQTAGALNCRCCGRLLCAQHCGRRIRLSATAQPSASGVYCRCCDDCYDRASPGNRRLQKEEGRTRSLSAAFLHLRKRAISTALLEGNRIEKRLEKLAIAHAADASGASALASSDGSAANALISAAAALQPARARALQTAEQAVVAWEDDAAVASCPFCSSAFGRLSSRRHHCRLCGRVVCGRSACSSLLSVPLPPGDGNSSRDPASRVAELRACADCEHVVLRQRDRAVRAQQQLNPDALARLYAAARECMATVEATLPAFNALAIKLQGPSAGDSAPIPMPGDIARAARIRKQLTAAFNSLDTLSKRIVALPAANASSTRLHVAIRRAIAQYLQLHMFPLTMMMPERSSPRRSQSRASVASSGAGDTPSSVLPPPPPPQLISAGSLSPPSSLTTLNADDAADFSSSSSPARHANQQQQQQQQPLPPAGDGSDERHGRSSSSERRSSVASSLFSLVRLSNPLLSSSSSSNGKPAAAAAASSTLPDSDTYARELDLEEESIRQALLSDPGKHERIAAMNQDEKIASLEVLRDQRQRVLGYIGDAQRARRIDDAVSLQASLDDLDTELSILERSL